MILKFSGFLTICIYIYIYFRDSVQRWVGLMRVKLKLMCDHGVFECEVAYYDQSFQKEYTLKTH